jgi:cytochrome c6
MKKISSIMILGMLAATALPLVAQDSPEALYKSKCQVCHGADGKGSAAGQKMGAKAFSDPEIAKQSDEELVAVTKKGKGKMPSYDGKLTDDQIKSLVKYIRTLK